MIKVLNICQYLPIDGFPPENDITLKIYADLKKQYGIESLFVMPLSHIPKWATYLKNSLKVRYKTINKTDYLDEKYQLPIRFFQSVFLIPLKLGIKMRFKNTIWQFSFYKNGLYKYVDSFLPNIIHAHTIDDAFFAYRIHKKFKIPYIITLRGSFSEKYEMLETKKILKNARYILTPSFNLMNCLKGSYKIDLVPHGLEEEWFVTKQKKMDIQKLRLVTVSRLLEMKNIHVVLKALFQLKKENKKFSYQIIGDGPFRNILEELVISLDLQKEVEFLGQLDQYDIRKVYENRDLFVMLSESETFGRAYFEAAAQGLLVIGVKNTGADGYFTNDEAFFIDPTIDSAVKVLKGIDEDLFYKKTIKLKRKSQTYHNDKVIKNYIEIFQKALK